MTVLETKRLSVRHFSMSDAEAMDDLFGDKEVMRFGDGIQTHSWVCQWLRGCIDVYHQQQGWGLWAVVASDTSTVIGYCGLLFYPDVCGQPETEIAYRLVRRHWGRGYATEAVIGVRDHGFDTLGMPRLIAMIDPENVASIRVAEKAGMRYEKDVMFDGYTHPDRVYAVTRPAGSHRSATETTDVRTRSD